METLKAIYSRRSIRKYEKKEIPQEIMEEVLKAGSYAPSAVNKQPWEFIVLTDREKIDRIPDFHPHAKMLFEAPAAIVVCGDKDQAHSFEYMIQDVSAAIQTMLLAAYDLGIGTCWLGIYPREERMAGLKEMFNLPSNVVPLAVISMGYPAEVKESVDRFHPEKVHYNNW